MNKSPGTIVMLLKDNSYPYPAHLGTPAKKGDDCDAVHRAAAVCRGPRHRYRANSRGRDSFVFKSNCAKSLAAGSNSGTRGLRISGRRGRKCVILELIAQNRLLDFAGRCVRNFADEDDVVRHPPIGNLAVEEAEQFVL